MISSKFFGKSSAGEVNAYTLDNGKGLVAEILDLGGIIRRIVFDGTDVVLGRETAEGCLMGGGYLGAAVGRNSNRIEGCEFELNGKVYKLEANDAGRDNNLHGGPIGYSKKVWNAETVDGEEPKLILTLISPDGDQGFPGNAEVKVTYTLTKENSIKIHYEATCDADTVFNMTNHSYFNMNGHTSGPVTSQKLWMNCDFFTPNTDACVADGSVLSVKDTPFDFTTKKEVGKDINDPCFQIQNFKGYDHNFVINGRGFRKFAELTGDKTGITMECFTDTPAVQLYTGNYLKTDVPCKDGAEYGQYGGLCLETRVFPNALKYAHYPSPIVKKGEKYDSVTEYKFTK